MNILVLGGTGFLGPQFVEAAIAGGHTVTLFNRGKTNPGLFDNLEKLQGDRNAGDYASLKGRTWDVCVDIPSTRPMWVEGAIAALKGSVKSYLFISTISVYPDFSKPGTTEDAPTHTLDPKDRDSRELTPELYGGMKAECERLVREAFPKTATIIRPGLIVGPEDPSDRFTYWPVRIERGGEVMAPGPQDQPVQFIDAHDLGAFMLKTIEDGHAGTYNATGPRSPMTMAEFLYGCRAVTSGEISFTWVDEAFLLEQGVQPWSELPLWAPGDEMRGFAQIDCSKAISIGLTFRPLAQTARETIDWHLKERGREYNKWQAGIARDKATAILKAWHERQGTPTTRD